MVFAARLTQQGHKIASMDDLMELYEKIIQRSDSSSYGGASPSYHPEICGDHGSHCRRQQAFSGADHPPPERSKIYECIAAVQQLYGTGGFRCPYSIMTAPAVVRELYLKSCNESMKCYEALCTAGSGHDAAGYATPQGLRNVLLISATPYQWKHIISQRVCRRNTDETRIVLLKVWKELYELSPTLFAPSLTGPFCQMDRCLEGKMTCGRKLQANMTPEDILEKDYPALWEGDCR